MSIKDWPEGERPREKLLERGACALSDAELLAVLLRIGTQGMSAVDLARSLLTHYGGLSGVMTASQKELSQHKGMGVAAYAQFATVLEIGKRVLNDQLKQTPIFKNSQMLGDYLRLNIGNANIEIAYALFLDSDNKLISSQEIARGTVNENTTYPREIAKLALISNASAVVFAHNHPSGNPNPSDADFAFTHKLAQALNLLDIILLDHFIITPHLAVSFQEQGWLNLS